MRRWLFRLGILVAVVAVVFILRFTLFKPDPVPVTVFVVARGRVDETVTNSKAGTVKTRHRARLSSEVGGRVAHIAVHTGDRVAKGDMLVRIDDTQYRAQLSNAQQALTAAKEGEKEACLAQGLAERDFERAQELARGGILSSERLDQTGSGRDVSRAGCEAARARVGQLGSQLQMAQAELAKTVVRAPFSGVVAELTVEQGEWITPSPPGIPMPAVLDLLDPDAIYVSAPLDEVDRGRVAVGLPVRITLDAFPGKSFDGKISRIAPYILDVAEQSRTFEVEAILNDDAFARTLPPGASADVEVILSARDGVVRIPTYALVEGTKALVVERECPAEATFGGRLASFLRAASGECLVTRTVTAGLKNWEFVEIMEGLKEGERIVVSLDRAEVKEGARVRQSAVAER